MNTDPVSMFRANGSGRTNRGRMIRDHVTLSAHGHGVGRVVVSAHGIDRGGLFVGLLDVVRVAAPWARLDQLGGSRVGEFFHTLLVLGHPDLRRADETPLSEVERVAAEAQQLVAAVNAASGGQFPGRVTATVDSARLFITGPDDIEFPRSVFAALAELDVAVRRAEWDTVPAGAGRSGVLELGLGVPAGMEDAEADLKSALGGRDGVGFRLEWA